MQQKRAISGCAVIVLMGASAWAGTIQDPAAGVESDNFSSPISTFVGPFDPSANGGLLRLFNDTGAIITGLSLHTTIHTGLEAVDISSSFTCNSGSANPFFQNCGFDYISATGSLTISFTGVFPPDADELDESDGEVGEQEGIPPIVDGCLLVPDDPHCGLVGHFAFVFNDNFQTSGNVTNGWNPNTTSTANPGRLLFNGQPLFDAPGFTTTASPEPASLLLLGGGILGLAALSRRRLRG